VPELPPVVNDGIFPDVRAAINNALSVLSSTERLDLLRNGAFTLWQRGTSFALNTPQYTADGWVIKHSATTMAAGSVTRQTFAVGQAAVPQDPDFFLRVSNTSSGSYASTSFAALDSPIPRVRMCSGEKMTVSFWARASYTKTIAVSILQSFGTGGSTTSASNVQSVTLTTAWVKYVLTFDIPSTAGKIVGANNAIVLRFMLASGTGVVGSPATTLSWGGTGDIDFALVKLEKGANASPFIFPDGQNRMIQEEYCKMFYQQYGLVAAINAVSGGVYYLPLPYAPMMARTPTVTPTLTSGSFGSLAAGTGANSAWIAATATATFSASFINLNVTLSAEIW
jgi:hypothetical protein